jgi:hypothetical protein
MINLHETYYPMGIFTSVKRPWLHFDSGESAGKDQDIGLRVHRRFGMNMVGELFTWAYAPSCSAPSRTAFEHLR